MAEIAVPEAGQPELHGALADRLGEVNDGSAGHRPQAWADAVDPPTLTTVAGWGNWESCTIHMSSGAFRRFYQRLPDTEHPRRPTRFHCLPDRF